LQEISGLGRICGGWMVKGKIMCEGEGIGYLYVTGMVGGGGKVQWCFENYSDKRFGFVCLDLLAICINSSLKRRIVSCKTTVI
jgi:hypothetical protein